MVGMDGPGVPDAFDAFDAMVRCGALVVQADGPTLAEVLRVRVPLSDAEAATIAIPLAQTLDELHAAGLAYGPPGAADVAFAEGGRPVLVVPQAASAGPDDDIPGLLHLVLDAMTPPWRPELGEPDGDEGPDLRPVLEDLLAGGCTDGDQVVAACFDVVQPEPIRLPDAGALARAHVLGPPADGTRSGRSRALPRPAGPARFARPARLPRRRAGGLAGAEPGSRGAVRRAQRRRARRQVRAGATLAVAVLLAVAALVARPGAVHAQDEPSPGAVTVDPVLDRDAPAAAAAALTRHRAVVLVAGDVALLDSVDLVGSPARLADEALLAALGADRIDGLSADVQAADEVAGSGPEEARVEVTSAMSPYRRVGGSRVVTVPGTPPRTVLLHLRWTDDGWRVWQVSEPPTRP